MVFFKLTSLSLLLNLLLPAWALVPGESSWTTTVYPAYTPSPVNPAYTTALITTTPCLLGTSGFVTDGFTMTHYTTVPTPATITDLHYQPDPRWAAAHSYYSKEMPIVTGLYAYCESQCPIVCGSPSFFAVYDPKCRCICYDAGMVSSLLVPAPKHVTACAAFNQICSPE